MKTNLIIYGRSALLSLALSVLLILASCNNSDTLPAKPVISANPTTVSGMEGETVDVNINWSAPAGVADVSVNSNDATVPASLTGTQGSFISEVTLGKENSQITYTITDDESQTTSTIIDVAIGTIIVKDKDLAGGKTYNWTKEHTYLVDGLVFLEKGGILNIEAGTVVKFKKVPSSSDPTSGMIITRGAQIFAEGTSDAPVIFTAEADQVTSQSLTPGENGQWAGLILLGTAPVMKKGNTLLNIEGISTSEPRGQYGFGDADFPNADPNDNSGTLKYVSIRYTGYALNGQAGDEIQGLTLGAVGAGTTIDYVESFASDDDGVEIFGGTVNLKHFVSAFASDDSFDFDEGWRGNGQYLFALQGDGVVSKYDHGGEWDGFGNPTDDPFSAPNLANCTFVGPGINAQNPLRDRAILWREGFAGKLINTIVTDYPGYGIRITSDEGDNSSCHAITNPRDGFQVEVLNITWSAIGNYDGTDIVSIVQGDCLSDIVAAMGTHNLVQSTQILTDIGSRTGGIDPRPAQGMDVGDTYDVSALGLENTDFRGAFKPGDDLWLKGWTALSSYGFTVQ